MILAILICIHLPKIKTLSPTEYVFVVKRHWRPIWQLDNRKPSWKSSILCEWSHLVAPFQVILLLTLQFAMSVLQKSSWEVPGVVNSPSLLQALSTLLEFGKVYPATCLAAGPTIRQWPYLRQNVLVQPLLSSLTAETVSNPSSDLFGTYLWHSCFHPCSQPAMPCALAQENQHL